ncbi:MAG TPA: histidine kinase [Dongiaceae bacterium]|nr:histidine kinase [Dongiaceae bacterium]
MKKNIIKKLTAGFSFCLLLIVSVVAFNYIALGKLEKLYQETIRHSVDMELATDAQHIGEDLYLIIANAVINRDLANIEQDWVRGKKENLAKLEKVALAADTAEEEAWIEESRKAFNEIIRIYEQEMLPLIRKVAGISGPLVDMDARIDRQIVAIDQALQKVALSMSNDNQRESVRYHVILRQTRGFGFIISLAGVLAVIVVTTLATRQIVGPLTEITGTALEIKKGNFLVGLKHKSDDEIGVLADAFRDMSEHVEKRTVELQASNEHLQQEILERRQAEEEVFRLNAQLERRVSERTAELVRANEQCQLVISTQRQTENELLGSREELRNLSARLQSVREEDRKRISREIHDELGQSLTALKFDLSWLGKKFSKDQTALYEKTVSMTALIESIIQTVQRISSELRPGMLDDLGLKEAMEWEMKEFQVRTGIDCEFKCAITDFNGDVENRTNIFRIFQEAMTNVGRHSQATKVSVILEEKADTLVLSVWDNGRGINDMEITDPKSLGLIGIRERARLCGGEARINGSRLEGTMVKVIIPIIPKNRKEEPRC